jgi:hypothetical protein
MKESKFTYSIKPIKANFEFSKINNQEKEIDQNIFL